MIPPDGTVPPADEPPADPAPGRPGSDTFTIEGRSAPALFVVGWLASLLGLGAVFVALLSGGGALAPVPLIVGLVLLSVGLIAGAGSQGIERRARGQGAYRGPSPFLVFAASIPVSLLAVILVGIPLTLIGLDVAGPVGALVSVALQAVIYIGLVRLLVVDVGALSWSEMGIRRYDRAAVVEVLHGAAWAIPVIAATLPVAAILTLLFPVQPVSPLPPAGDTTGYVINLVAAVLIAPIGEEILFRGFATTAWARDLGHRRALVRGALFFAAVHILTTTSLDAGDGLQMAIVQFGVRIPVALALGWLFLRRGTIWAPIGLHAAFNGSLLLIGELATRSGAG